ncbi:MAG: hypothetical protein A3E82_07625 [Gammaproteobacteria bacterium RIFCSPHIGHO2_12_FULL_38_11]|nr:MAG: hypothetical protein A3E82_07625 [Gammaproteobacteria bacterium RIFCSPHIGHO2_12_FULL_38_11]
MICYKHNKKKLTNIQMLRAFAAIHVVILHVLAVANVYHFSTFDTSSPIQNWGKCGVDIFFVISGFIMVYVQYYKKYSPTKFIVNRFIRILPLYWVLTAAVIGMHIFMPNAFLQTHFSINWALNSLFLTSQFLEKQRPMLFDAWTLEFEMVFYLLFAAALIIPKMRFSFIATALLIITLVITRQASLMLEFLFGMIVAVISLYKEPSVRVTFCVFLLGVILLLASAIFQLEQINRVILWGMPAALLVFGLVNLPQYKNALLRKLGDASYSIYLFQVFAYLLFYKALTYMHAPQRFDVVYMVLCTLFSIFLGYCVYFFVELRLTHFIFNVRKNLGKMSGSASDRVID